MILILDLKKVSDKNPAAKLNKKRLEKLVLCDMLVNNIKTKTTTYVLLKSLTLFSCKKE